MKHTKPMLQTKALIQTLKKALKEHGLSYRDVATELAISEASVKRLFAQHSFSVARFDQVCQMMGLQISDLVKKMDQEGRQLSQLTEEQELQIVADDKLLVVAFLVINGWQFTDILNHYRFSETELISYLVKMDRLKLIELLPNNRIKRIVSNTFTWRHNGPIQKYFISFLLKDFLKSRFDQTDEVLNLLSGMLAKSSVDAVVKKLENCAREFIDLNQQDMAVPIQDREGYSLILALRPWQAHIFQRLRRS